MSTKYKIRDQEQLYFISFAVVYWIDVFVRNEYREVLLDSLRYCQKNKGLEVYQIRHKRTLAPNVIKLRSLVRWRGRQRPQNQVLASPPTLNLMTLDLR